MNKQKLRELCEAIVNGGNPDDVLAAGLEFMQEIDPEKTLALLDENAALLEALRDLRDFYEELTNLPACKANSAIAKAESS